MDKICLMLQQSLVASAGDAWQQDKLSGILAERQIVLWLFGFTFDTGTRVGQTGHNAEQDGLYTMS